MKQPCDSCGEREATIHFTEIVGNEKRVTNLCEQCAREKAVPIQTVSLADLLSSLLEHMKGGEDESFKDLQCEACGLTYPEFQSSGRLGCPRDYQVFRKPLRRVLREIQDGLTHTGKVPPGADEGLARHNELLKLRRELDRAVLREDYERAKVLRDRIAAYQGTRRHA